MQENIPFVPFVVFVTLIFVYCQDECIPAENVPCSIKKGFIF